MTITKQNEAPPRRPKPAPLDHEVERKRLLQKLERIALKRAINSGLSKDVVDFDIMQDDLRRHLELAEDVRCLLDGKALPARARIDQES